MIEQVKWFAKNPTVGGTLIIDTADWTEKLAIKEFCDSRDIKGIEDMGYGKGYVYIYESMGKLLNELEEVVHAGMNIVITAHAAIRKFEQPDELGAYDRWELKCINAPRANICAMLKEWADMVLFVNWKTITIKAGKDKDAKLKAAGGTERVMYTQHRATFDAKNRFNLPEELPFSFSSIAHLFSAQDVAAEAPERPSEPQKAEPSNVSTDSIPPQEAAEKQSEPAYDAYEDEPNVPQEVIRLMKLSEVHPYELRFIVAQRGYFPADMLISQYPREFVDQWVIPLWSKIFEAIKKARTENPFLQEGFTDVTNSNLPF